MIQTTVSLLDKDKKFLDKHSISLSKLIRNVVDRMRNDEKDKILDLRI